MEVEYEVVSEVERIFLVLLNIEEIFVLIRNLLSCLFLWQ